MTDNHSDRTDHVGRRVRTARKLGGLTQRQLADRANVSLSLVKQVEQGRVPASPAFVAAVGRAMRLETGRLTGQPYPVEDRQDHRVHAVIPALRREVASYRLAPDDGVRPRALPTLSTAVAKAARLRHSASLDALGAELPALLAELRAAILTATGQERRELFRLLAEAYAAAGQVAHKLGYADLSSLTTDRVEWAAQESADPLASAAADFYVAGELIATAEWRGALAYLENARQRIEDQLRADNEPAMAMTGVLHLKSGLAAARSGDATTSDAHLAEARSLARRVTAGSDHYRLAFDTDSVNIWSVALAVERHDGTEAVRRAEGLRFGPTAPRERVGHHWIDVARAFQLHGDRHEALVSLQRAKKVSPLQARYSPQVRETIVTLAEHDRRRSDTLAGLARWVGVRV